MQYASCFITVVIYICTSCFRGRRLCGRVNDVLLVALISQTLYMARWMGRQALKSILVERRTRRTRVRIETCPVAGEVHSTVFRVAGV